MTNDQNANTSTSNETPPERPRRNGPFALFAKLLVVLTIGFAGYVLGHNIGFDRGLRITALETLGNIDYRVNVLAALRNGDTDAAIRIAEAPLEVGTYSLALPYNRPFLPEEFPPELRAAKAYFTVYPSDNPDLMAAIADIPPLPADHPACGEHMRNLIRQSQLGPAPNIPDPAPAPDKD